MEYRYRFLTSERFDNVYITRNFREIDMRRAKLEKETVLPLNNRERKLYVSVCVFEFVFLTLKLYFQTGSIFLAKPEKKGLSKSAVVLLTATIKLCTHMMTDYALYWVLTVIRYHARYQSKVKGRLFRTTLNFVFRITLICLIYFQLLICLGYTFKATVY